MRGNPTGRRPRRSPRGTPWLSGCHRARRSPETQRRDKLPGGKATPVCAAAAPTEAASLPAEVGPVPLPPAAGGRPPAAPAPGSAAAPVRLRLGRRRLGPEPLDLLRAPGQVGVGGAEVGRVGLCVVVAVRQRRPHREPAWSGGGEGPFACRPRRPPVRTPRLPTLQRLHSPSSSSPRVTLRPALRK